MLLEYVDEAMNRAVYEKMDDGAFWGRIPACPGVVATSKSLAQCQRDLRENLDGWISLNRPRHSSQLRPLHA